VSQARAFRGCASSGRELLTAEVAKNIRKGRKENL